MTQEDKDLLIKDLCGRIPYGVKVDVINEDNEHRIVTIGEGNIGHLGKGFWIECKPYLFPMSKVVEEIVTTSNKHIAVNVDFFHENRIDYRGLIEKGLANDATGLNIY